MPTGIITGSIPLDNSLDLRAIFAAHSRIWFVFGELCDSPSGNTTTLAPDATCEAISINSSSLSITPSNEICFPGNRPLVSILSNKPPGCQETMTAPLSEGRFSTSMTFISRNQVDIRTRLNQFWSPINLRDSSEVFTSLPNYHKNTGFKQYCWLAQSAVN